MTTAHPVFTIEAGIACLIAAALIWWPGEQRWPRVTVVLVIAGVGCILPTRLGQWCREGVLWAEREVNHLLGSLVGVGAAWLIAIVAAALVGWHLHLKKVSRNTLAYAATVPLTVTLVPGFVGTVLIWLVGAITWGAGWLFYFAFHGVHGHL